jgi:hypothetical protein
MDFEERRDQACPRFMMARTDGFFVDESTAGVWKNGANWAKSEFSWKFMNSAPKEECLDLLDERNHRFTDCFFKDGKWHDADSNVIDDPKYWMFSPERPQEFNGSKSNNTTGGTK